MKTILKSSLSVIIPTGYLIWLAIVLSGHPSDAKILDTVRSGMWFIMLFTMVLPQMKGQSWLYRVPILLVLASWAWLYIRLSPSEVRNFALIAFAVMFGLGFAIWLLDIAYGRARAKLLPMTRLIIGTASVTAIGLILVFSVIAVVAYSDITWSGMVSNWGLTLTIIYLPLFLGAWFVRGALERRKIERKTDA